MYFQLYQDRGQFRWRLRAANHRIIGDSGESYWHRADCISAIGLVMGTSTNTPIYEV